MSLLATETQGITDKIKEEAQKIPEKATEIAKESVDVAGTIVKSMSHMSCILIDDFNVFDLRSL